MASSSYYYGLMIQYSREKRKIQEKLEKWKNYLEKLNSFSNALPNITNLISSCNSSLLGGGYLVGEGQSLDNGKLQEIIGTLENDSQTISGVISYTSSKIEEFAQKITELTNLYNEAQRNYNNALAEERAAAAAKSS